MVFCFNTTDTKFHLLPSFPNHFFIFNCNCSSSFKPVWPMGSVCKALGILLQLTGWGIQAKTTSSSSRKDYQFGWGLLHFWWFSWSRYFGLKWGTSYFKSQLFTYRQRSLWAKGAKSPLGNHVGKAVNHAIGTTLRRRRCVRQAYLSLLFYVTPAFS